MSAADPDGRVHAIRRMSVCLPDRLASWKPVIRPFGTIADGSAAQEFDAEFTTVDDAPADVPPMVLDEVLHRTPGFAGWQQERWLFHCSDAAEFVGKVGISEIADLPAVVQSLVADGWNEEHLQYMSADGDLTGYLFRCRHCGTQLAYADAA